MRLIFLSLIFFLWNFATAKPIQIIPSDLSVQMTANPDADLLPHQIFEISISVTNHGPSPIHAIGLYSSVFFDEFALRFESNDCHLSLAVLDEEDSWSYVYFWYPNDDSDLAVGQTKTCHLKLALSLDAPRTVAFSFRLPTDYIDSDPGNDSATIYLTQAVAPIPSDSWPSRTILASLLIAAAWFAVMRRHRGGQCGRNCGIRANHRAASSQQFASLL